MDIYIMIILAVDRRSCS